MKAICLFLILLSMPFSSSTGAEPPAIKAAAVYRTTVSEAKSLVVFEGLPHQTHEKELFTREIKRRDTAKIWNYPFYTPGAAANQAEELRKLLGSERSITVYSGPRLCGGYHPDFGISWKSDETTYHALICFGCQEIVFFDGSTSLIYDLDALACSRFQELLAVYKSKRPEPIEQGDANDPFASEENPAARRAEAEKDSSKPK